MSGTQWLIAFHVLAAFLMVAGALVAGLLHLAAVRRERPSEVALLLGLTRVGVVATGLGAIAALGLGIWLAEHVGYGLKPGWISASLVLWVASGVLGGAGGGPLRRTRELAERLAAEGDAPSEELRARLASPLPVVLNWGSFLAVLAILGLMIWKP